MYFAVCRRIKTHFLKENNQRFDFAIKKLPFTENRIEFIFSYKMNDKTFILL